MNVSVSCRVSLSDDYYFDYNCPYEITMLPEFLFSNSHVELLLYIQIDEEQRRLLRTVVMEICDST